MLSIRYSACLVWALLLLILPLNWLAAAFIAALAHEACHILAILLLGGQIHRIQIGAGGAVIETTPLTEGRELLCATAGPLGSLLLIWTCSLFPRLAICAFVQGVFNLLPIYPLDGGRILACICHLLIPGSAELVMRCIEGISIAILTLLALIATFLFHLGGFPMLFTGILILKALDRKRPCKRSQIRVQ